MTQPGPAAPLWRTSLHGGHSGQFCDHAQGTLREVLEAAVEAGYHTFGVSEHAPRTEARFLYPEEVELGWGVETLHQMFIDYARTLEALARDFEGRLVVLRGLEAEVVPEGQYVEDTRRWRALVGADYIVGSVHFVGEEQIDGKVWRFERAMEASGGLEALAVRYYETLAVMIDALRPEVVGHFDLVRKLAGAFGPVDTPPARNAARRALEAARAHGCILDLNTAGWRKGLDTPYPAPWLVAEAHRMGLGFCFGDDSHGPQQVGDGIDRARRYLLDQGVTTVTVLTRRDGELVREVAPLG